MISGDANLSFRHNPDLVAVMKQLHSRLAGVRVRV